MAATINFVGINVNSAQNNGGVFVGENNQANWDANNKLNTIIDIAGQHVLYFHILNIINDNDALDFPVAEKGLDLSAKNDVI